MSVKFEWCFKVVARKFQECFKKVSRVFQESFKCVSRKIEVCFKIVLQWGSRVFERSSIITCLQDF